MVALIRGINVGGRSKLPMADLRAAVERCGHTSVRTYIQSGNVVFRADVDDPRAVEAALAAEIAAECDVAPAVMARTADQWSALIADNPFVARAESVGHLHVVVLGNEPEGRFDSIDGASFLPEELAVGPQHVYLLLPGGIGRSKLASAVAALAGDQGTARNWRTVTKLAELLDEFD